MSRNCCLCKLQGDIMAQSMVLVCTDTIPKVYWTPQKQTFWLSCVGSRLVIFRQFSLISSPWNVHILLYFGGNSVLDRLLWTTFVCGVTSICWQFGYWNNKAKQKSKAYTEQMLNNNRILLYLQCTANKPFQVITSQLVNAFKLS